MNLHDEVNKRRTFAIIAHPDAGKTTLTERLLMQGNLIRSAGTVKGKKSGKFAASDWMEIEKQRGISVTSSVINFPYEGKQINILDTPGHEDFSEDTYRTLTAVDSVVMVIDATKGIELQTIKLFKVCRMRGIPIFTFINKLDREGKEPLELLEEIEQVLEIETYPMNWPVGSGKRFLGVHDRQGNQFVRFNGNEQETYIPNDELKQAEHEGLVSQEAYLESVDDLSLLDVAGESFSLESILTGKQTPVFFGSALAPFGVENFFNTFIEMAPAPNPRKTNEGPILPDSDQFSGFIFKIQANMNTKHRDRVAFLRVCSGKFERGMHVKLARNNRVIKLAQSQQFVASSGATIEEAYAGDIVGIYDPNIYQIGDTLSDENNNFEYEELPKFPPEIFNRVIAKNVMKSKQFKKGIEQLVQEGAIQLFYQHRTETYILGAVGQLQYDVFKYRMKHEYNVEVMLESMGERIPRWLKDPKINPSHFDDQNLLVRDREGNLLVLFKNDFGLRWFVNKNPDVELIDLFEVNTYESY